METNITGEVQIIEACLRTVSKFSHFEVHNICNGKVSILPYGDFNLIGIWLLVILGVCFVLISVIGVFKFIFD